MPARPIGKRPWRAPVVGGGLLLAVLLLGCSAEKRYKVLSFFFDGVPDPNAPRTVGGPRLRKMPGGGTRFVFQHKPVAEGECVACHKTEPTAFTALQPVPKDICMECHEPVLRQYPQMHGPVLHKLCRWCHEAHESTEPFLLKKTPAQVCGQCHDPVMLGSNPPEHADPQSNCTLCHSGHGGTERFFLKASAQAHPASAPAPAPATMPATETTGRTDG